MQILESLKEIRYVGLGVTLNFENFKVAKIIFRRTLFPASLYWCD